MPKLAIVKKKRKRSTSLEAQLKREAAKIYESGMAQAYNAAVGQMLIRKLDEVLALAAVTGYRADAAPPIVSMQRSTPPPPKLAVEHPCTDCGEESLYKTRPNKFNRMGSWYCRGHEKKGRQLDLEDRVDRVPIVVMPATAPVVQTAPVIQQVAPTADPILAAMGMADAVE